MDSYTVHIEARGPAGSRPVHSDAAVTAFADAMKVHKGTVAVGQDRPSYSAAFSVDADTPVQAAIDGSVILRCAALDAGLPDWDRVRVEAVRADVLDEDLGRPPWPELVSRYEAAAILGVHADTDEWRALAGSDGFPAPVLQFGIGSLWAQAAIEKFRDRA